MLVMERSADKLYHYTLVSDNNRILQYDGHALRARAVENFVEGVEEAVASLLRSETVMDEGLDDDDSI